MKKFAIIIIVILVVALLAIFFINFTRNKEISDLKSLRFYYTRGYAMNSDVSYELSCNDKCTLKYKPYGVPLEDTKFVEIEYSDVRRILAILNQYNVASWDGFSSSDKDVLDGDSFNFYVTTSNDGISASGYMKYPKHYKEVRDGLENIFNEYIK